MWIRLTTCILVCHISWVFTGIQRSLFVFRGSYHWILTEPDEASPLLTPPTPSQISLRSVLISYSQGRQSLYSTFQCRCVHIVLRPKSCIHFLKLIVLSGIEIRHCLTPNQSSFFLNKQVSVFIRKLTAGIMALRLSQFHCWTDQTQIFLAGGFHF